MAEHTTNDDVQKMLEMLKEHTENNGSAPKDSNEYATQTARDRSLSDDDIKDMLKKQFSAEDEAEGVEAIDDYSFDSEDFVSEDEIEEEIEEEVEEDTAELIDEIVDEVVKETEREVEEDVFGEGSEDDALEEYEYDAFEEEYSEEIEGDGGFVVDELEFSLDADAEEEVPEEPPVEEEVPEEPPVEDEPPEEEQLVEEEEIFEEEQLVEEEKMSEEERLVEEELEDFSDEESISDGVDNAQEQISEEYNAAQPSELKERFENDFNEDLKDFDALLDEHLAEDEPSEFVDDDEQEQLQIFEDPDEFVNKGDTLQIPAEPPEKTAKQSEYFDPEEDLDAIDIALMMALGGEDLLHCRWILYC